MNSNLIIRICVTALVIIACMLLWQQLMKADDGTKLVGFIFLGITMGILAVKFVLPWIGDAMGESLFSSGEQLEQDDMMKAAAKLNLGDYEGAIGHYEKVLEANPADSFPVSEIAKIHAEKLHDPQRALQVLSEHLQRKDWPVDDAAFLMFRIVDVNLNHLHDFTGSRDMLDQVIANFPGTRHSANAHHKLTEIEQAEYKFNMEQRARSAATTADAAGQIES